VSLSCFERSPPVIFDSNTSITSSAEDTWRQSFINRTVSSVGSRATHVLWRRFFFQHIQARRNKEGTTRAHHECRSRPPRTSSLFRIRSAKASTDTVEKRSKISTVIGFVSVKVKYALTVAGISFMFALFQLGDMVHFNAFCSLLTLVAEGACDSAASTVVKGAPYSSCDHPDVYGRRSKICSANNSIYCSGGVGASWALATAASGK